MFYLFPSKHEQKYHANHTINDNQPYLTTKYPNMYISDSVLTTSSEKSPKRTTPGRRINNLTQKYTLPAEYINCTFRSFNSP